MNHAPKHSLGNNQFQICRTVENWPGRLLPHTGEEGRRQRRAPVSQLKQIVVASWGHQVSN